MAIPHSINVVILILKDMEKFVPGIVIDTRSRDHFPTLDVDIA